MKKLVFLTFKLCIIFIHFKAYSIQTLSQLSSKEAQVIEYFEQILTHIPKNLIDTHHSYSRIYSLLNHIFSEKILIDFLGDDNNHDLFDFVGNLDRFSNLSLEEIFVSRLKDFAYPYLSTRSVQLEIESSFVFHKAFKLRPQKIDIISKYINNHLGILMSYFLTFDEENKPIIQTNVRDFSFFIKIDDQIKVIYLSSTGVKLIPLTEWRSAYKEIVYNQIGKHTEAYMLQIFDSLPREEALAKYRTDKISDLEIIRDTLLELNPPTFKKNVKAYLPNLIPLGIVADEVSFHPFKLEHTINYVISKLNHMSLDELETFLLKENEKLIKEINPARFLTIGLIDFELAL